MSISDEQIRAATDRLERNKQAGDDGFRILERLVTKIHLYQGMAWERELELWIRPKPAYIPLAIWRWMLKTVLVQVEKRP